MFFKKTINCKKYLRVERTTFSTLLHSKRYRLIHRQNSHVPRGLQCTGRRKAQNRERVKGFKKDPA
jgi:hypothetical protein